MVRDAIDAPTSASISTPVFAEVDTRHSTMKSLFSTVTLTWQLSRPNGWQSGISSPVFLAAMMPARIAVWTTGPFAVCNSPDEISAIIWGGRLTMLRATAVRSVTDFSLMSTMVGLPLSSTCEIVFILFNFCQVQFLNGQTRNDSLRLNFS